MGCRLVVPNGAASVAACMLGALAGRNLVLLLWVTLDSEGSTLTATNARTTHAATTSQRNRTAKRPMAAKTASICMGRDGTRSRLREQNGSQRPLSHGSAAALPGGAAA